MPERQSTTTLHEVGQTAAMNVDSSFGSNRVPIYQPIDSKGVIIAPQPELTDCAFTIYSSVSVLIIISTDGSNRVIRHILEKKIAPVGIRTFQDYPPELIFDNFSGIILTG